ncbi:hypothetical protein PV325_005872 [Microctonus aethiopoides]|nr:hypothetical protein PV325_005872 [Microctonus aethiopoides]
MDSESAICPLPKKDQNDSNMCKKSNNSSNGCPCFWNILDPHAWFNPERLNPKALVTLMGTMGFRIYKTIMQAVQKTSDGHPFKDILDIDLTLPTEKVHQVADVAVAHANAAVSELRRLFLIEDFVDSLKFSVVLWCLTYLGSWFNGMTLIIIGVVALFTLPKVYETNKAQIDQNLALVHGKINELTAKVKAAIPLGKKAEPTKEE